MNRFISSQKQDRPVSARIIKTVERAGIDMDGFSYFIYLAAVLPLYFILRYVYIDYRKKTLMKNLFGYEGVLKTYYMGNISSYLQMWATIKQYDFPEKEDIYKIILDLAYVNKETKENNRELLSYGVDEKPKGKVIPIELLVSIYVVLSLAGVYGLSKLLEIFR